MSHAAFMKEAIEEAKKAWKLEEVPIGAVIVHDGGIIAADSTSATRKRTPLPMRSLLPSMKPRRDRRLEA